MMNHPLGRRIVRSSIYSPPIPPHFAITVPMLIIAVPVLLIVTLYVRRLIRGRGRSSTRIHLRDLSADSEMEPPRLWQVYTDGYSPPLPVHARRSEAHANAVTGIDWHRVMVRLSLSGVDP